MRWFTAGIILCMCCVWLTGLATEVDGATFYVAATGRPANPGTRAAPWSTGRANASLRPGDTAVFLAGEYMNDRGIIAPTNSGTSKICGRDGIVRHNIVWRNWDGPLSSDRYAERLVFHDNRIYNNVFYGNYGVVWQLRERRGAPEKLARNVWQNNVFFKNDVWGGFHAIAVPKCSRRDRRSGLMSSKYCRRNAVAARPKRMTADLGAG